MAWVKRPMFEKLLVLVVVCLMIEVTTEQDVTARRLDNKPKEMIATEKDVVAARSLPEDTGSDDIDQLNSLQEKRHIGPAMSNWLEKSYDEGKSDHPDMDKRHLGSAMSGWLKHFNDKNPDMDKSAENPDMDKRHLGSAMSGWLKQFSDENPDMDNSAENPDMDKRHLGSAMSGWLKQFRGNPAKNKKQTEPAISEPHHLEKRHIGSVMSGWLKQQRGRNDLEKRHLGSASSRWLNNRLLKIQSDKRHLGSSMSGWLKNQWNMDKRNLGSAMSGWLKGNTENRILEETGTIAKEDNAKLVKQPEFKNQSTQDKRHMGSASSNWLRNRNRMLRKNKREDDIDNPDSPPLRTKRSVEGPVFVQKRFLGSAVSEWLRNRQKNNVYQPWASSTGKTYKLNSRKRSDDEENTYIFFADQVPNQEKRHLGTALNRWHGPKIGVHFDRYYRGTRPDTDYLRGKRHIGAAMSFWLQHMVRSPLKKSEQDLGGGIGFGLLADALREDAYRNHGNGLGDPAADGLTFKAEPPRHIPWMTSFLTYPT